MESRLKIAKLLEQQCLNDHSEVLTDNFGDRFLFINNQIYRNIRKNTLKYGFQYSNKPNSSFLSLPLSELENILHFKQIPYVDNVTSLVKLNEKLKGDLNWDEIVDGYRKNYVFHESCHAVARSLGSELKLNAETPQKLCTKTLLEESFANACELLALVDTADRMHRIFYEMNSYTVLFEVRTFLEKLYQEVNPQTVMKFTLLSYLHSNFLRRDLAGPEFDKTLSLAFEGRPIKLSRYAKDTFTSIARTSFTLDLRFRTRTTGLFFKMNGLSGHKNLLNIDFLSLLEKDSSYHKFISEISKKAFD